MVHNRKTVSSFFEEFDTGWLTPHINFVIFISSIIIGIAGIALFISGAIQ